MKKILLTMMLSLSAVYALHAQQRDSWLEMGNKHYAAGRYAEAVECYMKGAEEGSAEAQFDLAYAYYNGEGIARDFASAVRWFKRAANQDFAKAQFNLAYCYMYGRGVPRDYDKAIDLLLKSGNNGFRQAQLTLAECYEKGVLVEQDTDESARWAALANSENAVAKAENMTVKKPEQPATPEPENKHKKPRIVVDPENLTNTGKNNMAVAPEVKKQNPEATSPNAPVVKILYPEDNAQFHTDVISVRFQLLAKGFEAGTTLSVLVDGKEQPASRAVHTANTVEVDVPNHDCDITLVARNKNGNSAPASIHLIREQITSDQPRLFVLAVGVGKYDDPQLPSLKFTCKDATDFSNAVRSKLNHPFSDVQIKLLTDEDATRDEICEGLKWLSLEALPTDVCMFFFAGHGYCNESGNFFFMSYGSQIGSPHKCLSTDDFRVYAEKINGKFISFTDACYSAQMDNVMSSSFAAQMRRSRNDMVAFSSSEADSRSREDESWQNGAFTKALVQAFNGAAKSLGDSGLTTQALDLYLTKEVRRLTDNRQTPIYNNNGVAPFNIFNYE